MTELVKKETVTDLVGKYNATIESMKRLFEELADANKSFQAFQNFFPFYIESTVRNLFRGYSIESAIKILKAEAWGGIIKKTQMLEAMTERRRAEIEKQIQEDKMPEITVENIYSVLNSLYAKSSDLLTESIKEAFEILRPRRSKYKTNSEFDVPPKVIVKNWIEKISHFDRVTLGYHRGQIQSVCNAFSLMDGKGVSKYPCNLETAIKGAIDKNLYTCETEYFKCKWYLAGTLHLEFKRLDLLAKLNQIGGGSRLYK